MLVEFGTIAYRTDLKRFLFWISCTILH